jgi:hypothetical protein
MRLQTLHTARCVAIASLAVVTFGPISAAAELKRSESSTTAQALVNAALRSELDGATDARKKLLDEALSLDPDYAPARWQSGFVRYDDQWLTVDQAAKRAASDPQLTAYRKMRDGMVDTADNHRDLAKWCRRNKLADLERIHWAKVLRFEPGDSEAIAGLGLQLYQGQLLTRQQIEQEKKSAGERMRAMQTWQPKMTKWRTAIERGSPKDLDDALRRLKELSDPAAVEAMEAVFAINPETTKSTRLNLLLVEVAGRIPGFATTRVLRRRALLADSFEVRTAAANELKKRPMHTYVPWLIAAMPSALETRSSVDVLPGGGVIFRRELTLKGLERDMSVVYDSVEHPLNALTAPLVTPVALNRELVKSAMVDARTQQARQSQEWLRERIRFALRQTTGFDGVEDPALWQSQYADYYGWRSDNKYKPEIRRYNWDYSYYYPIPAFSSNNNYTLQSGGNANSGGAVYVQYNPPMHWDLPRMHTYCFAAGTPVLTISGLTSIEKLKVGDLVLSQNPQTGELVYKAVQQATLRNASRLTKLELGSETLSATAGHPFWVDGYGWQTAKHVTSGAKLHALQGAVTVETVEDAPAAEVYNLIVSEFNTFFVGQQNVLVHDDSGLAPTAVLVPGLNEQANTSVSSP